MGAAALWRGADELIILGLLINGMIGLCSGLIGTVLIAVSYSLIGHSLGDPRLFLAGLLIIHLLAAAFWIGALPPLHRAVDSEHGASLLHRFGMIASGTVAVLVLVGLTFAWQMAGSLTELFTTAYGWVLLTKLAVVVGLMGLAALNKWRLVPALLAGDLSAATKLRRSIRTETIAVLLILIATATLTSITTPPVNL